MAYLSDLKGQKTRWKPMYVGLKGQVDLPNLEYKISHIHFFFAKSLLGH